MKFSTNQVAVICRIANRVINWIKSNHSLPKPLRSKHLTIANDRTQYTYPQKNYIINQNYRKVLESDWLSTGSICDSTCHACLIRQYMWNEDTIITVISQFKQSKPPPPQKKRKDFGALMGFKPVASAFMLQCSPI